MNLTGEVIPKGRMNKRKRGFRIMDIGSYYLDGWSRKKLYTVYQHHFSKKEIDEIIDKKIKNRNHRKKWKSAEDKFQTKCYEAKWTIRKGNHFADFLLHPVAVSKILRRAWVRKEHLNLKKSICNNGKEKSLKSLFRKEGGKDTKEKFGVRGLPDFIVMRNKKELPFWVEIKSGKKKYKELAGGQGYTQKKLEELGFKVLIHNQGSRFSAIENQLNKK